MSDVTDRCPWCGTTITHVRFLEIEERIRSEEKRNLQELELATQKRLEEKFRHDLEAARAKVVEVESEARKRLEQTVVSMKAERDRTLEKVKALEAREAAVRTQVTEEAAKNTKKIIEEHRLILERDHAKALGRERAAFTRDREATQKKVADLERQLAKQTAFDLGEGAEIDIYETLRDTFRGDHVRRVPKGEAGADIHHEVLYKGESCGLIVIDSKNRKQWRDSYASKLHEDKVAAKAQHAILTTLVFPTGKKELCTFEGVLVMSPARAVTIVELLRCQMIQMHVKGLTMRERNDKVGRLYTFITSDGCAQHFKEADRIADEILELDVQEVRAHNKNWRDRGAMARRLKAELREVSTEISAIVEGGDDKRAKSA